MLRGLSSYYYKEPTLLFLVRVAQGLVHMGKGLLNLAPKHANGNLISGEQTDMPQSYEQEEVGLDHYVNNDNHEHLQMIRKPGKCLPVVPGSHVALPQAMA